MPASCNVLRRTDDGELVVAADFAATGRTTATFRDLAARLDMPHNFWEIAPVPYGRERGMTGRDQAERWASDIGSSGLKVRAVLGFCGGSVYAGVLAERIAEWQEAPRLVLIDPGLAQRRMLAEHVAGWLRRFASSFSAPQLADAEERLRDADASTDHPLELAEALGDLYRRIVMPALIRAGHSAEASNDFADLVTGYLHWLGGAVQLDPRAAWSTATALNSETPEIGLRLVPPEEREALVGQAIYFDVPHAEMLRTSAVAATVDDLVGAAP